MFQLDTITAQDWVSLAVGAIGALTAYLGTKNQLPSWARKWLGRIGNDRIQDAIERAGAIAELTPEQRRKQAVIYLQKLCIKDLGFPIPSSIANLLGASLIEGKPLHIL